MPASRRKPSPAEKKRLRQEQLCDYLAKNKHALIKDALVELGIPEATYNAWRHREPEFAARVGGIWQTTRGRKLGNVDYRQTADFVDFRKRYFGRETYRHQHEIVKRLNGAPPMSVSLILCPPEAGKSTVITDWLNHTLGHDPNHRILYISKAQKFSIKQLGRVARRMTDVNMSEGVRRYIGDYGPFHIPNQGKPWTNQWLTVARADHDEADYSLEALGWGGQVYGARADTIVLDDVQTLKTLSQTDDILDWFRQDVITRPGRTGRIIVIGTRIGMGDFYSKLIDEGIVDVGCLVQFPALNPDGSSYCPEMWPDEALTNRRQKVGRSVWWTAYMMRPQESGEATFPDALVDEADDRTLRCERQPGLHHVASLDPALGGGNALVVAAYTAQRFKVVDLQLDYGLARTEQILDRIEEAAIRFQFSDLIIETAAFQRSLARDDRLEALGRRYGFRVREHETAGRKSDPILGVAAMARSFIQHEIDLAAADEAAIARLNPLRGELRGWRPTIPTKLLVQDCVMAMWFGWRWWMSNRTAVDDASDQFNTPGMPWRPTGRPRFQSFIAGTLRKRVA